MLLLRATKIAPPKLITVVDIKGGIVATNGGAFQHNFYFGDEGGLGCNPRTVIDIICI